jgi:acyl-CoA reductase-like NAD-dependent aldehyde dehydrogenase
MKQAPLLLAGAALLLAPSVFGSEPVLNIKAICKSRAADAKMLGSPPAQSNDDCARDEESAKQQLTTVWGSTSAPIRKQCVSDAHALGTTSYLDLVTCIQLEEETKAIQSEDKKKLDAKKP